MIIRPLLAGLVYRAAALAYFRAALSAKGSRLRAGRFNRPDISALYVSLEPQTAYAEYQQGLHRPRPCAVVAAEIRAERLVDLTDGSAGWTGDWAAWDSDWSDAQNAYEAGDTTADCPSWRCGDDALARHCSGIIFPSARQLGGVNLALFVEDATAGDLDITVIDPLRELRDASAPARRT